MDDVWTLSQIWTITPFDKNWVDAVNRFRRILRMRYFYDFRTYEKVKLAGRKPGGWTVILGTGCFYTGINLFISLITLHFPTVFIAIDGRYDRGDNYRWCNF